jgi:tetratricopeptide (TPR) repeat protein
MIFYADSISELPTIISTVLVMLGIVMESTPLCKASSEKCHMAKKTSEELFEKGRAFLRKDNTLAALSCFEKACSIGKVAGIRSYLGLCLATERGQVREGIALCTEAIAEDGENPVHYFHLGKIYLREKRRAEAIEIFRQGLSRGDSEDIRHMLEFLRIRKKPVFFFLPRDHFLNKYIGKTLRILRLR